MSGRVDRAFDVTRGTCRAIGALTGVFDAPGAWDAAWADVSEHRRRKVAAFRFERDRRLSLMAGLLLDELLCERGLREREMAYFENEAGKPFFADLPDLHFSLAHSGEMAVAALSVAPVGIDVEHLPAFAADIADPREWTAMESVGKALGTGVGGFVDAGAFQVPAGFDVEHFDEVDGYLICLAQQVQ